MPRHQRTLNASKGSLSRLHVPGPDFECSFETLKMKRAVEVDVRRESKIRKGETLRKSYFKNDIVFLI
jgi:hypothetical protein